jgi:hypothetical protein
MNSNLTGVRKTFATQIHPAIGNLTAYDASYKLEALGYSDIAKTVRLDEGKMFSLVNWPGTNNPKPWQFGSHAFGFIPKTDSNPGGTLGIQDASEISPDDSLKNSRIKIVLNRLRVFDYPGSGNHQILFNFAGQNQVQAGQTENVHFTQTYQVQQGGQAGIIGYPIFIGLNVGSEGIAFQCSTVNVKNDNDAKLIGFLDSDIFRNGLNLLNTLNPALPVITEFATGLTKGILKRNENICVQNIFMGLDFASTPGGANLAQGSYVAVQVPQAEEWDWSEWVYNARNGQIVPEGNLKGTVPYNYLVFGVSKMSSTPK